MNKSILTEGFKVSLRGDTHLTRIFLRSIFIRELELKGWLQSIHNLTKTSTSRSKDKLSLILGVTLTVSVCIHVC